MVPPLLRQEWTAEMGEARRAPPPCMQVLFYRDTRACSTIQIGKVDATGASISAPIKLDTYWSTPSSSRAAATAATARKVSSPE